MDTAFTFKMDIAKTGFRPSYHSLCSIPFKAFSAAAMPL